MSNQIQQLARIQAGLAEIAEHAAAANEIALKLCRDENDFYGPEITERLGAQMLRHRCDVLRWQRRLSRRIEKCKREERRLTARRSPARRNLK